MNGRAILLLLLIGIYASESTKTDNRVKKIVKRVSYIGLMSKLKTIQENYERAREVRIENWKSQDPDDIRKTKLDTAYAVYTFLTWQSSVKHDGWEKGAELMKDMQSRHMKATVCGSAEMNQDQYNTFMRNRASHFLEKEMETVVGESWWGFVVSEPTTIIVETFWHQKSTLGYRTKQDFHLKLKFVDDPALGAASNFSISEITISGGCTEQGEVNYSHVDIDKATIDDSADAKKFLDTFDENSGQIPEKWLEGLDDAMTSSVCNPKAATAGYSADSFRLWYKAFSETWNPKNGDESSFKKVYILKLDENEVVGRLSMKLQVGIDDSAVVHEWNIKIVSKSSGDSWKVVRAEVLCPVTLDDALFDYPSYIGAPEPNIYVPVH